MGGRGASGGGRSGRAPGTGAAGGSRKNAGKSTSIDIPTFSKASINKMSRSNLETLATAIFANKSMAQGLTAQEGTRRAKSLMDGNTTAQLRKYVLKYGGK